MCVAEPAQVLRVDGEMAEADVRGVTRRVPLILLESAVSPGDWLLVHTGLAVARITAAEAHAQLTLLSGASLQGVDHGLA
jgi:hydrogenase expression/formation protein HypC